MNSILLDLRKLIAGSETNDEFDADLMMHANTYIAILSQLGYKKADNFRVTGTGQTWDQLIDPTNNVYDMVKSWIQVNVQMVFDPPTSSVLSESKRRFVDELGARIHDQSNFGGDT